jgi:amino acid adenylation domain-containing protein
VGVLATDRPRGSEGARLSARDRFDIDPRLVAAIRASENVSSAGAVQRGFVALLARYTDPEEIMVLSDGDDGAVLLCDLSGNPSFAGLADRITVVRDGAGEQQPPVMFCSRPRDLIGVAFELACTVIAQDTSMTIEFAYDGRLFDPPTIRRLAEHLQVLLADGLTHPEQPVSRLDLLTPGERELLTGDWARNPRPLDLTHSIVELFEQQADCTPDAVAFSFDASTITFAELRDRSHALAHGLIAEGVDPGAVVGVYMSRTLDYPVAMLGVLRAAATCLPLAHDYPSEPLRWIVGDARPVVIVTVAPLATDLGEVRTLELGELELAGRELVARRPRAELPVATADDLMYVIYTSGSTGRPKGVEVPHRVALNRLAWMWREYPFEADEVCCQRTATNFVDSFWELLGPLLRGVPTVIVPARKTLDDPAAYVQAFVELAAATRVTRTWVVPSVLRLMLDVYPDLAAKLLRLTFWVCIGEAVPADLLVRFECEMPHATLFNVYGASEIWDATWWDSRTHRDDLWRVPIGRPIDNVEVRVVDRNLEPVPVGVPGELLVGGVGLARGYVGRPDLTADQFIENPRLGAPEGSRFYRTGDLVRWGDTGELEYIGRIDRQIQIYGCRVEPAEVEARLLEHPDVVGAAVTVDSREPLPRLAAYVVAAPGRFVCEDEVRAHMQTDAPWYEVPAVFVTVPSIPLTHSGKVDRLALPPIGA